MTYTAIARDPDTGQIGIAIATYSLAVGASCPHIRPGIGAVSTQAATFLGHGPELLDLLSQGSEIEKAFELLRSQDKYFEYRQIGIVTAARETHVHTGSMTRSWAGSLEGEGWLAMGNVLASEDVVAAMGEVLSSGGNSQLSQRLLAALEAGRGAGGQQGLGGRHLPERSAVVTVYGAQPLPLLDLRVDDHPDAVTEMRRIFDRFQATDDYYRDRAERPDSTPPQDRWMAENGLE